MANTIFYSLAALVRKILFCHSKIKFISSRHRVISSLYRRLDLLHSLIFLLTFFLNYLHPSFYTCMNQWRIQGRGLGGLGPRSLPPPLLYLDLTKKIFWETVPSPPSPLPSPLISRSGSGTVNLATVSMDRMALRSPVQYPLASQQTSVGVRLSRIEKWMRDNRTPTDVCGEAKYPSAVW